jgi:hypothetical protein
VILGSTQRDENAASARTEGTLNSIEEHRVGLLGMAPLRHNPRHNFSYDAWTEGEGKTRPGQNNAETVVRCAKAVRILERRHFGFRSEAVIRESGQECH